MTTPFQEALLALEIATDALHATARASPEAALAAQEAFDQIRYLGFVTRPSAERKDQPPKRWGDKPRKPAQGKLFP